MKAPRMYTTPDEVALIRRRLNEHNWYAKALENLRAPCDEFLKRGITIPRLKGYVFYETCPKDNTRLYQNPFEPDNVYCPTCGTKYTEENYFRAWVWFYHINLSQRARDMGVIYQMTGDEAYASAVRYILKFYAEHYTEYPNEDNVLGPTRLFQSTYQEGLWIEGMAGAADLIRDRIPDDEFRFLRDNLFIPSAEVVMDYDEKQNNRQVMNNGGIGAVGILCEEDRLLNYALHGPHGWFYHLEHSVLEDGLWYEGDNYHFASLPSMANLADAMGRNGLDLFGAKAGQRAFKMMFDAPMFALYPDLTFPARKDSQFASAANQRWYAGLYELAYRRYGDPAYGKLLRAMYNGPKLEGSQLRSASGAIDIQKPHYADREWLDWRGFLNAQPDLGSEAGLPVTKSLNMGGTGLAVLRQDGGRTYASLDYGHYGGGHGHPDRMQINFYARGHRWLTDWGTGNYFLPHLRWYRSSVGHNTVVVDGRNHLVVDGVCRRFGATPGAQLASGQVSEIYPGVGFRRTALLLSPDLLLDLFEVEADQEHQLDWVLHPTGELSLTGTDSAPAPATIQGEHYEWLQEVAAAPASGPWTAVCKDGADALGIHMIGEPGTTVYRAGAYGAPNRIPNLFPVLVARRKGRTTTFATLYEHREGGAPVIVEFRQEGGHYEIALADGGRYVVTYDPATAAALAARFGPDGRLVEASGFGVSGVEGAFAADFPLETAYIGPSGRSFPERFGRVRLADGTEVRQEPAAWTTLEGARVFAGLENLISLRIHNYTAEPLTGELGLELPPGWKLISTANVSVAPGTVAEVPIAVNPGHNPGEVTVGLTGDRLTLTPAAPVAVEAWFPNVAGAILRAQVSNLTGLSQGITVSVGGESRHITDSGTLDFPVTWRDGEMSVEVTVTCGTYTLTRTVRAKAAFPGREYRIDDGAQVRRSERHWRGPDDLSATFRLDREGDRLRLHIAVTDDAVKCSGPAEAHFDYDSVQVYFDPRPDRERKNTYLNGVYGLVLVPASEDGQPERIFPIGPVEASQLSGAMAVPPLEGVKLASRRRPDGYDLELELPIARLGCEIKPGDKLGFDLILNDNDGTFRRSLQMIWTGSDGARTWLRQDYHAPQRMGLLLFPR